MPMHPWAALRVPEGFVGARAGGDGESRDLMAALHAENASFIRRPEFPSDVTVARAPAAAPATTLAENGSFVRPPWFAGDPGVQQVLCCDAPVL